MNPPYDPDTIRRLAETDPYWSAYLDGLVDKRGIRDARTYDYDTTWTPVPNSADLGGPRVG